MTDTKSTKATPAKAIDTEAASSVMAFLSTINGSTQRMIDVRNVGIARALQLDIKGKSIAESLKVQQSTVSIVNRGLKALKPAQRTALSKLAVPAKGHEFDEDTLTAWSKLGPLFRDTAKAPKAAANAKAAKRQAVDPESGVTVNAAAKPAQVVSDALAAIFDVLVTASDEEVAGYMALIQDTLTPEHVADARAELEAASESIAA